MKAFANQKYTLEEYFELERNSEDRWEFWDGHVWNMAGGSNAHETIVSNLIFHLRSRLPQGCRVWGSNMKVVVPDFPPYRYPDVSALCGNPEIHRVGRMEALVNPQLIVEVLSPTTEAFDRGAKFSYYKSILSFVEYLLVAADRPNVIQYTKLDDDRWVQRELNGIDKTLALQSFNAQIKLSEIYVDVQFPDLKPELFLVER